MPVRGGEGSAPQAKLTAKQRRDRAARRRIAREPVKPLPVEAVAPLLARVTAPPPTPAERRQTQTVERAITHGLTPRQRSAALQRGGFRGAAALAQALRAEGLTRLAAAGSGQAVRSLTPAHVAAQLELPTISRDQQYQTAVAIAMRGLEPITSQAAKRAGRTLTSATSLIPEWMPATRHGYEFDPEAGAYRRLTPSEAVNPMIAPWPGPIGPEAMELNAVARALERGAIAPKAGGPWGRFAPRKLPPTRTFTGPTGRTVDVPAAGGKFLGVPLERAERLLDVSRPWLSPATGGLVRTEGAKFFKAKSLNAQMVTRGMNVQSRLLQRLASRWAGFRKMKVGEAYALHAYATNTSPELWATAAERWAGEATSPANRIFNLAHADYYRRAGAGPYLEVGPSGIVEFAATPEGQKLAHMYGEMEKAIGTREEIGRALGQLTDEKIAAGISKPGRIARGAKWVEPTPGRLGVSKAHERSVQHRQRIERAVERAEERTTKLETVTRVRTLDEAKTRLAELDAQYDALVNQNARRMGLLTEEGKMTVEQRTEAAQRGAISAKAGRQEAGVTKEGKPSGASGKKYTKQQPLRREIYEQAEDDLLRIAAENPETAASFRAAAAERDALRAELENPETMFEAGPVARELGTVTERRLPLDKYARKQLAGREVLTAEQQEARQTAAAEIAEILRPMEKAFRALQADWNRAALPEYEERAALNRLLRAGNDAQERIAAYAEKAGIPPEFMPSISKIEAQVEELTERIAEIRGRSPEDLRLLRKDISKMRAEKRRLERAVPVRLGGRILTPEGQLLQPKGWQRLQNLRAELSGARMREAQLEQARLRRIEPTGLVGAEDFISGRLYTHTQPGAPGLRVRTYAAMRERFQRAHGTKLPNNPKHDPRMRNAMKGALLRSGRYSVDPLGSVAQALETAVRMDHFSRMLRIVQENATPVPRTVFDQIVVLDPEAFAAAYPKSYSASKQAMAIRNLYEELNVLAAKNPREFRRRMLDESNRNMLDQLRDAIFPSGVGEVEVGQAIPGAGFVNAGDVNEMGIFRLPEEPTRWGNAFSKFAHYTETDFNWLRRANTLSRFQLLYLNPAYITVNLTGNALLNLFQQGIFLPRNVARASYVSRKMDKKALATMDANMGEGLFGSAGPASRAADIISAFVDRIPRRMSFIHEANRQGYRTTADLERLLLDPAAAADLQLVRRRAVDAIVDYERLSPFERAVTRNILAFYPWTKGAIRYSIRFPFEHPYQALAVAAIGVWQDEQADKILGDKRPPWMQFALPVATASDGRPIVVNLGSLVPFTVPVSLGETAYGFARGDPQWGNLLGLASPAVAVGLESATGTTGIGTAAPYGAPAVGTGFLEQFAPYRLAQRGSLSKAALGALNPEAYTWAGRKRREELVNESKQYLGKEPTDEIMNQLEARGRLDQAVKPYEGDPMGKLKAAAKVYADVTGDNIYVDRAKHGVPVFIAENLYQTIRDRLTNRLKMVEQQIDFHRDIALR